MTRPAILALALVLVGCSQEHLQPSAHDAGKSTGLWAAVRADDILHPTTNTSSTFTTPTVAWSPVWCSDGASHFWSPRSDGVCYAADDKWSPFSGASVIVTYAVPTQKAPTR